MSTIVEVPVPSPGESISEVYIASILKQVGDIVSVGDGLLEVDSDKATLELPAPVAGEIVELLCEEGDEVPVGKVIAKIKEGVVAPVAKETVKESQEEGKVASTAPTGPAARVEADKLNVDINTVDGSGNRGRVFVKDVQNAAKGTAPAAAIPPVSTVPQDLSTRERRVKMTPLRRTIARRLVEAQQTAAMLTTFNEADMTNIKRLRKTYQDRFVKKYGLKLGFMSFFIKAAVEALKAYPAVNAEIDGNEIVYKNYYNIGVAVSTKRGLVVPIVRDADKMSFAQIEQEISNLAGKARDGKLQLADFQGGTFTISNGGVFGSLMSTPILNPPQVGILGMHTIQERPVNVNGQVEIRPMMYLALSYDHRIIDGSQAVGFLVRIKDLVENPERVLLEI
ncbi:MAG: dihydrolipoyllysine-residue succinyltransferase [Proteobacteria bacterium]|nr:dihydrolipoyllysine-residue succinyltransferase [Pseudomonadota bacterium]